MWERIRVITIKEFRQALREPRMRIVLFVPPVLQLILFGFAVNLDVSNAQLAWLDLDRTSASTNLRAAFDASPTFTVSRIISNEDELRDVLDRGDVMAVVRVLPGFGKEVKRGQTSAVQVMVEGTNSNTASLVGSYASQIIGRYASEALQQVQRQQLIAITQASGGPVKLSMPSLEVRQRVWFNPDLKSRNYFVPG